MTGTRGTGWNTAGPTTLLFSVEPVTNAGARGRARGTFHTAVGVFVASIAQEALLRGTGRVPLP